MDKKEQIILAHELLDRVEFILDSWITKLKEGHCLGREGWDDWPQPNI